MWPWRRGAGGAGGAVAAEEELKVELHDGLEEGEVGGVKRPTSWVQMLDDEDLCEGEGEEGALALEAGGVLAALARVGALEVHDNDAADVVAAEPDALGDLVAAAVGVMVRKAVPKSRLSRVDLPEDCGPMMAVTL